MSFDFFYYKPDVKQVLNDLDKEPFLLSRGQLYCPINETFLKLNSTNASLTTFNYTEFVQAISSSTDDKPIQFTCINTLSQNKLTTHDGFIKFSPLLDPIRYLAGKYDLSNTQLKELPVFGGTLASMQKVLDPDNASYVDSFFSYLSSKLLHEHNFINSLDCYGSVLGHKKNFVMDVVDDMDYLMNSDFFIQNNKILYEMQNDFHDQILNHDSRSRKRPLRFDDDDDQITLDVDDMGCFQELDSAFEPIEPIDSAKEDAEVVNLVMEQKLELAEADLTLPAKRSRCSRGSTTCSSRTSHTSASRTECSEETQDTDGASMEGDDDNEESSCGSSTASEDKALISIFDFPVQAIFLERCENTLDDLCAHDEDFGSNELCAALMQVIMTLIAYKKCFDFQHNDLHTNNVMFVPTKKQFLYYKVNDTHYKVPTYGRIFKIIDFGRATYKFRGHQVCSDSFHKDGDAHTQFNFGRHYNPARPVLMPNNSFDLCRLGTSLIDFLIDDLEDLKENKDPVVEMVAEWCTDDQGRNVLWKSNGDERYPGFKLYKMIPRTVSKHTPISQLSRPILDKYRCARKNIKQSSSIMNIDKLPSYIEAEPKPGQDV